MSTFIPDKSRAYWKIFNYTYLVWLPAAYVRSEADIKRFGTPTTGDPELDTALARQPQKCWRTISEMAELFDEGVPVRLGNVDDMVGIYDIIQEHLSDMRVELSANTTRQFESIEETLRGIQMLDSLARYIHPKAYAMRPAGPQDFWAKLVAQHSVLKHPTLGRNTEEENRPAYKRFEDMLPSKVLTRTKRWQ